MRVRLPGKSRTHFLFFVLISTLVLSPPVSALASEIVTAASTPVPLADTIPKPDDTEASDLEAPPLIDETQRRASVLLIDAAEWFDSFFDDSRISDEENKSQAKVRVELSYYEVDGWELSPSVRWRIHLPKLSKRANLIIFAKEDPDEEISPAVQGPNTSEDTLRDNFAAGLQLFLRTSEKYNISTTFGGSFNYLYGGLRFRYYKDLGSWQGRFVERVRYYTDDGWENYVALDLERHISKKWLFRTTGLLYWREFEDSLEHSLTFQFYQFITDTKAISYEWVNSFETDPSHRLDDLTLRLRYRQQFLRDWLIYEVAPQVNFPYEYDRDAKFGITFTVEAKFGNLRGKRLRNIFSF